MKNLSFPSERPAFTLIELLVVIAIIVILAALLFPVIGKLRGRSLETKCLSNLRLIGTAAALYRTDNDGKMVPYFGSGSGAANWMWALDPYAPTGLKSTDFWMARQGLRPGIFSCPARTTKVNNEASYGMTTGVNVTNPEWGLNYHKIPHPSSIIYIAEIVERNTEWTRTSDGLSAFGAAGADMAFRHSPDKSNVLFCDGHAEARNRADLVLQPAGQPSLWRWW